MHDISALPLLAAQQEDRFPGLVWAYGMRPGEQPRPLGVSEIGPALAAQSGWIWLHVDLIDHRAHGWVGELCALPASARAILEGNVEDLALGHDDGVVHGASADFLHELDDAEDAGDAIGRLCFAVTEHLLVTGRRHQLSAPETMKRSFISDGPPPDAFDLFGRIIGLFCRKAAQHLASASAMLDEVEDRLVAERIGNERRRLMGVRRMTIAMHRPVAALVALFRDDEKARWPLPASGHAALRQMGDRLAALDREIVAVNDRARLLQEEVSAALQEESNSSLKALTIMSALLLPGTLVFGIFGMNTAGLPFSESHWGFLGAMAVGAAATGLFYWLLTKAGANLRF